MRVGVELPTFAGNGRYRVLGLISTRVGLGQLQRKPRQWPHFRVPGRHTLETRIRVVLPGPGMESDRVCETRGAASCLLSLAEMTHVVHPDQSGKKPGDLLIEKVVELRHQLEARLPVTSG